MLPMITMMSADTKLEWVSHSCFMSFEMGSIEVKYHTGATRQWE